MDDIQRLILETLAGQGCIEASDALRLQENPLDPQAVLGVLKRLAAHEVLISFTP